jgi:transposase-like protein
MSTSILSQPFFHNEEAAYEFVESRLWANGVVCPHCGEIGRSSKMQGKSTRIGAWKCYGCRKPFTVKVGTIFESSHIKMNLWLQAIFLIASSKKGISSNQLHRTLGITLKSAWFMSHRIREAMRDNGFALFGAGGGSVEVDETFIGKNDKKMGKGGTRHKQKVLSLVDRDSGKARSVVVDDLKSETLFPILMENMAREAHLLTDDARYHERAGRFFASHKTTNHRLGEYVDPSDSSNHTNTVEGFFSVFKRGMKGVYQHCGHNHLNRYLHEFDFRYNNRAAMGVNDFQRAENLLMGVVGKRLTYQRTH